MRSKTRRTIPGKYRQIIKACNVMLLLIIILLLLAGIGRSVYLFYNHGAEVIKQKISLAADKNVELERISLRFPNRISLHHLNIKEKNKDLSLFKSRRLDLFFGPQILLGIIRFNKINLVEPCLNIQRNRGALNYSNAHIARIINNLSYHPTNRPRTLDPLQWPVDFQIHDLSMHKAQINLTDNADEYPLIKGFFDVNLSIPSGSKNSHPLKGTILVRKCSMTHKKLTALVTGSIELLKNLCSPSLVVTFPDNSKLKLQGAVRDYLSTPVCRLNLAGSNFNIRSLAPLRYPFMPLNTNLAIEGELQLTEPKIYDTIIPAINGNFSFADGKWILGPLRMQLPENSSTITGTIILDKDLSNPLRNPGKTTSEYGMAHFIYRGTPLILRNYEKLYEPVKFAAVPSISSLSLEMGIMNKNGVLQVSSLNANSDYGTLLLEGFMDPMSLKLDMLGKLIVPGQLTRQANNNLALNVQNRNDMVVTSVKLTGTVTDPEILYSPRNNRSSPLLIDRKDTLMQPETITPRAKKKKKS